MPTKIDVAAKAAHDEISTAVEKIQTNLLTSHANFNSTSSSCHDDPGDQLPSPLYRDEVQQQEMNYLDGLLLKKKASGDDDGAMQKAHLTKGDRADGNNNDNLSKESVGYSLQPQTHPPVRSKIASILSPYDYKDDDDEKEGHVSQKMGDIVSRQLILTDKRCTPNMQHAKMRIDSPNRCALKQPLKQQRNTISRKLHNTISNLIHRSSNKPNKKNTNKKQTRTAAPSRNKRRQMNYKVTQRKIITKMVKLGRRCTQSFTTIKHKIENSVKQAIRNAHSMLEQHNNDTSCGVIDLSNARKGYNMYMKAKNMKMGEVNYEAEKLETSQKQPAVPPPNVFESTESCYV